MYKVSIFYVYFTSNTGNFMFKLSSAHGRIIQHKLILSVFISDLYKLDYSNYYIIP